MRELIGDTINSPFEAVWPMPLSNHAVVSRGLKRPEDAAKHPKGKNLKELIRGFAGGGRAG